MQTELVPHSDRPPSGIRQVAVDVQRGASGTLDIWYLVFGSLDDLLLPPASAGGRADNLWETTCFELFLRHPGQAPYREFNFSPSGNWAAYALEDYRTGLHPLELNHPPIISVHDYVAWLEVHVTLPVVESFGSLAAVTAVIEEKSGTKSYWALAHPPEGPPDFHHPACFVLELPPPGTA